MILRSFTIALSIALAACSGPSMPARAQDIGAALTVPRPAPPPQAAQNLRSSISRNDPARMLVIGDSLAQGFGLLLQQQTVTRDLAITVTNRGRVSTGLARADYYNWPDQFTAMIAAQDPDIIVAHFGANDMQEVNAPEGRTARGTPDWEVAYRVQIRKILALAAENDIVVYWIGPGPDGNRELNAHLAQINPWINEETTSAGGVYFPITDFTTSSDRKFARTVTVDGRVMAMRTADGSHFTGAGYKLVADRLLDAMTDRFARLDPATSTTPPRFVLLAANLQ